MIRSNETGGLQSLNDAMFVLYEYTSWAQATCSLGYMSMELHLSTC